MGGMPFGGAPEAPPGFRPIPMSHAMMEFAAPIMAYVEDGTVRDPNDALQIGMLLWNANLPEAPAPVKKSRSAIVRQIRTTLHIDDGQEAEAFFDRMIERKAYLFPDEIQPKGTMTMFMRKEVEYLITTFDEEQLNLLDKPIPPDRDDDTFLNALRELDANIAADIDYSDWEADFFAVQDLCCQRYQHWLQAKGVLIRTAAVFRFVSGSISISSINTMPVSFAMSRLMTLKSSSWIFCCVKSWWNRQNSRAGHRPSASSIAFYPKKAISTIQSRS
jgi:hypothetical protein